MTRRFRVSYDIGEPVIIEATSAEDLQRQIEECRPEESGSYRVVMVPPVRLDG